MSELGFRIEASAKAFEILANNLYSDKISAVIRELSCNAADAHAEAGIPVVPFVVDLPTNTHSFFRVRDFGNGLQVDQMEEIFTVFFSSTKVGSKSYTGSFGLGCKSPFAITDKFFVNSYVNGIKYEYQCFKNDGIPCITLLRKAPTNEKTGIEIVVPLNRPDVSVWRDKAKKIYEFFKIKPNLNVKLDYFCDFVDYKSGSSWESTTEGGVGVVMSNVRYRLDLSKLYSNSSYPNNTHYKKYGIVYHVPPRSIEVTPSREEIAYTSETVTFLQKHIEKTNYEFFNFVQKNMDSSPSRLNAQINFALFTESYKEHIIYNSDYVNAIKINWQGKRLSSTKYPHIVIEHDSSIEIGTYHRINLHSSNFKSALVTNQEYEISGNASWKSLIFLINDSKASQENIKSWANRLVKSNGKNITLFVIKAEYAFLIKDLNKLNEDYIRFSSRNNLFKSSVKRVVQTASFFKAEYYCMITGICRGNNDSNIDIVDNTVYFISHDSFTGSGCNNYKISSTDCKFIDFVRSSTYITNMMMEDNDFHEALPLISYS